MFRFRKSSGKRKKADEVLPGICPAVTDPTKPEAALLLDPDDRMAREVLWGAHLRAEEEKDGKQNASPLVVYIPKDNPLEEEDVEDHNAERFRHEQEALPPSPPG